MRTWRLVYWLITGALLGLGLTQFAGMSLGVLLLPIGLVLLLIGLFAARGREVVAGVASLEVAPALLFVWVLVVFPPPPDVSPFTYGGAILSSAITAVGLVALVLVWRARQGDPGPATT